jgi:hypothetical protein
MTKPLRAFCIAASHPMDCNTKGRSDTTCWLMLIENPPRRLGSEMGRSAGILVDAYPVPA